MNNLIYFLAVIGAMCVLGFIFFLIVGIVNSVNYARSVKKGGDENGEWKQDIEYGRIYHCVCSVCNKDVDDYISGSENWWLNSLPNFCPNCGADMREGDEK